MPNLIHRSDLITLIHIFLIAPNPPLNIVPIPVTFHSPHSSIHPFIHSQSSFQDQQRASIFFNPLSIHNFKGVWRAVISNLFPSLLPVRDERHVKMHSSALNVPRVINDVWLPRSETILPGGGEGVGVRVRVRRTANQR